MDSGAKGINSKRDDEEERNSNERYKDNEK